MKVSFYHLGNMWLGLKAMVEKMGIEIVLPPKMTNKTLAFGTKHSPESACEPFKYILGEYKEALEAGADTIFHLESYQRIGCRIPQYTTGTKAILNRLGYNYQTIPLGGIERKETYEMFKKGNPDLSYAKFNLALLFGIAKMKYIEWLEDLTSQLRPFEKNKGDCNRLMSQGLKILDEVKTMKGLLPAKAKIKLLASKIEPDRSRRPKRVMVVGDLYRILEHFANNNVFEKLGDLGVIPYRSFYLSENLRYYSKLGPWGKKSFKNKWQIAEPYIDKQLAFGTAEAVADTLIAIKEKKIDGIIHTYNFTCMPEIVNNVIFHKISKDFNIPLLSLSAGEHQAEAYHTTRIEAFVDMLNRKK
ncbi:hypothetical protein KY326_04305 [Candidatus Woesearchaeota archaeon]|nr:hypothetical protein [Candidatus Woesearchaeota archaeon]